MSMSINLNPFTPLFEIGVKLIDKLIPDPAAKAQAQLELLRMQRDGDLKELEVRMSAILAEAKSSDPWTSRARPSFLYVVYIMLLFSLPMGFIASFSPETAQNIIMGMQNWLAAIPDKIVDLFTMVMLGYIGGRTVEKVKGAA